MTNSKITTRPMRDSDLNFILSTWLKTYKYSSELPKRVKDTEYFSIYEPLLKSVIGRSKVDIACLIDEPDVIIGYLCYAPELIHWTFIKESWRNMGIAKMLLIKSGLSESSRFTHWTQPVNTLINKYPKFIYNPWLINI